MLRYVLTALSLVLCLQAEDAARVVSAIGAVHPPGVYGDGKCINGVILAGDAKQAEVLVNVDGLTFKGMAYPDRGASRILIKLTSMTSVSKDGQVKTNEVDGYLQDPKDGNPGIRADFVLADNAFELKSGSIGKLVLLRSVTIN